MPNDYENPKYTNKNEYHAGDGPFQFPWWAIVIGFVVWWPLGFIFIGLNTAMKNGKLGGFEEKARVRTQSFGRVNTTPVYDAEVRPLNGSALRRSAAARSLFAPPLTSIVTSPARREDSSSAPPSLASVSAAAASHALAQMNAPSQSSGATPSRSSRSSACALAAQSRLSSASSSAPQAQMLFAVSRISSSIALPPFASCRR